MEVAAQLRRLGLDEDVPREARVRVDGVLAVARDGVSQRFAAGCRERAPFPNELDRLDVVRERLAAQGEPLLVVPFVSESMGERLRQAGWSWADTEGNLDMRAGALVIAQRRTTSPTHKATAQRLPSGAASAATIRTLIGWPNGAPLPTVTDLAARVGVSQPRMSQILAALRDLDLAIKQGREWFVLDREALLDRFVDEYDQTTRSTRYLYSLDPIATVAERVAVLDAHAVVSADVGPDLIAPWRRPSVVVIYSDGWIEPADVGAVEAAGRESANVLIRQPSDRGVMSWGTAIALRDGGPEIPLAEPTQMLLDLIELGGADREEAAGVLRTWILDRP